MSITAAPLLSLALGHFLYPLWLSVAGHLHPYTGTRTKRFKKRWEFAHLSDFTCHFIMNFWKFYSKKGLVCFSWPMPCQQKVKPFSVLSGFAPSPGHEFRKNMGTKTIQSQENHLLQLCTWFSPFGRWDFPILHKDHKTQECSEMLYLFCVLFLITVTSVTTAHQEELRMSELSKELIVHPAVRQELLDFGGRWWRNLPFVYLRKNLPVIGFELLQMRIIRPIGWNIMTELKLEQTLKSIPITETRSKLPATSYCTAQW